jgi:hypothetical protein
MGEKGEGEEEQVEQLQGRVNHIISKVNPCEAVLYIFLISRWARRVREKRSRWSSCRAGSIQSLLFKG